MRIILYTGKGGVGKTSIAAATAVKAASQGKKVLIMSTDQAHSLGDSLGVTLSNDPIRVVDNLYALEIDSIVEGEKAWGSMKSYIKTLLESRADGGIETEELLIFPGLEELFSLFKITDIYEEGKYDLLIVDCAPTGETLALLKFPETFGNFIRSVLPMKKKATKIAGPIVEKTIKIPMPKADVFDDIESLDDKLGRLQKIITNKDVTSLRIVTTPERIVIKEAKHNYTCLHLYHYNVDAIIVNKIYPREALDGYFSKWISLQEEGLNEIRESFSNTPIFTLSLLNKELTSPEVLLQAADMVFKDTDATEVLCRDEILRLEKVDGAYTMSIYLPFNDKQDFNISQKGDELLIQIKNEKRCFSLPDVVKGSEVVSAKYIDGWMNIGFAAD